MADAMSGLGGQKPVSGGQGRPAGEARSFPKEQVDAYVAKSRDNLINDLASRGLIKPEHAEAMRNTPLDKWTNAFHDWGGGGGWGHGGGGWGHGGGGWGHGGGGWGHGGGGWGGPGGPGWGHGGNPWGNPWGGGGWGHGGGGNPWGGGGGWGHR